MIEGVPAWIPPFLEKLVKCFNAEDPVNVASHLHDDGEVWHFDIMPTVIESNDESYVRKFDYHLSAILGLLDNPDVMGDLNSISITGDYEQRGLHIVLHLGPDDEDDAEEALPPIDKLPKLDGPVFN